MKKPTVYLHVGVHKTGTTSIQKFCDDNFSGLLNQGILYSKSLRTIKQNNEITTRFAHHDLARLLGPEKVINKSELAFPNELKENFHKELKNTQQPINTVLVSSEVFSLVLNKEQGKKLLSIFQGYEIKVIIYLRMHHNWIESQYRQIVKRSSTLQLSKFVENRRVVFFNKVRIWVGLVSAENIIVKNFDTEVKEGSLIGGFLEIFDKKVASKFDLTEFKTLNVALPAYFIDLIVNLNKATDLKYKDEIFRFFNKALVKNPSLKSSKNLLSKPQLKYLYKIAEEEINKLIELLPAYSKEFEELRWDLNETLKTNKSIEPVAYPIELLKGLAEAIHYSSK